MRTLLAILIAIVPGSRINLKSNPGDALPHQLVVAGEKDKGER
jgi:hypothetical protein